IVTNGHRFTAPNQFRTAASEVFPTADSQLGRFAVSRAVPSFHWLNGKAISKKYSTHSHRLGERRCAAGEQLVIAWQRNAQLSQFFSELFDALVASHVWRLLFGHFEVGSDVRAGAVVTLVSNRLRGSSMTAHAPSSAMPMSTKNPI